MAELLNLGSYFLRSSALRVRHVDGSVNQRRQTVWRVAEAAVRAPFFRIRWKHGSLGPRPPLSVKDWDEIFEVMRDNGIAGLHAAGQMTDSVLERLAQLDQVTALDPHGSSRVASETLTLSRGRYPRIDVSNVLSEEKKQQVIALGRPG